MWQLDKYKYDTIFKIYCYIKRLRYITLKDKVCYHLCLNLKKKRNAYMCCGCMLSCAKSSLKGNTGN